MCMKLSSVIGCVGEWVLGWVSGFWAVCVSLLLILTPIPTH